MADLQPISPRIVLINKDGHLTAEGFRLFQSIVSIIRGEDGAIGLEHLEDFIASEVGRPPPSDAEVRQIAMAGLFQKQSLPEESPLGALGAVGSRDFENTLMYLAADGIARSSALRSKIAVGKWTPTLTDVANVDSSTAYESFYLRVFSHVECHGEITVDPTAGSTTTEVGISLPFPSNFSASPQCAGMAVSEVDTSARIYADTSNDRAHMNWTSDGTGSRDFSFKLSYTII